MTRTVEHCLNLFKAMLGEVGFFDEISEDRYESRYKSVATVLLLVYLIIITIVLLNLLIAVLSTEHAEVQEHADQEYKVLKARLINHYQLVVQEDLLPAPFNIVQLPFGWHGVAKRRVGYVAFWLVVGPAAVVGGALLWVVSAFLLLWSSFYNGRCSPACERISDIGDHLFLFVSRVLGCPLHLFGWWLTQPLVCVEFLRSRGCCNPDLTEVGSFECRNPVRVDDMLKAEGEPSVNELLTFLVDPLSDDKVREDDREKAITVEHVRFLRDRLDEAIQTTNRKVDTIHEKLNDLIELKTKQGIRGGAVLPGSKEGVESDGDGDGHVATG